LLIVTVPLFVRMPLWPDVAFYDICARDILEGGAPERDFVILSPPGTAWTLALVRSVVGSSSEALRLVDLAIITTIVVLLAGWLRQLGLSRTSQLWTAVLLFAFYLTASEWIHCQPDTWMLLPALAALHLRRRQFGRLAGDAAAGRVVARATLEGFCWGTACLIKPFVVLPGVCAWLASVAMLRRAGPGRLTVLACDAAGLVAGGLLSGAIWQCWLLACGTWHAYWHNVAMYRGEYYSTFDPLWVRPLSLLFQLNPWGAVHLLALPVALGVLANAALARRSLATTTTNSSSAALPLLAAFYVGWLVQSAFVQSEFDYHVAPTLMLAIVFVAAMLASRPTSRWGCAGVVLGVLATVCQPAIAPSRLVLWGRCWSEANSPGLRDRLALRPDDDFATSWQDLAEVAAFLKDRDVSDSELICYDGPAIPLYLQLGVRPGTRFLYPSTFIAFFPGLREAIRTELSETPCRYVVTDMQTSAAYEDQERCQAADTDLTGSPVTSSDMARRFPHSEPEVFRAGRYVVHEVRPRVRK
jgi:hypothetical protein